MAPSKLKWLIAVSGIAIILVLLSCILVNPYWLLMPSHIHAWTQSDRYALALGFIMNGFDFFHPQTFNLVTREGITQVDFPMNEYLVAVFMKLSGIKEPVVFRAYILITGIVGLVYLNRLFILYLKSEISSLALTLFFLTGPVYLYYLSGFLPSIPALSATWAGAYYYFRYYKNANRADMLSAVCLFTVAALMRKPFFIFLFSLFLAELLLYIKHRGQKFRFLYFIIGFVVFAAYQCYNSYLEKSYGTQFLTYFLWPSSLEEVMSSLINAWRNWQLHYFTKVHYLFLFLLVAFIGYKMLRVRQWLFHAKHLLLLFVISMSGSMVYLLVMVKQFPDHDYYFLDAFYFPVSLLFVTGIALTNQWNAGFKKKFTYGVLLLMIASVFPASKVLKARFSTASWDRTEMTRINFTGAERFLDEAGVKADARILVLDSYTTNMPLIQMNRKGYTVIWTTRENIIDGLNKQFDYVVIQNAFVLSDVVRNYPELVYHLKPIASNGLLTLYVRSEDNSRSIDDFLQVTGARTLFQFNGQTKNNDSAVQHFSILDFYSDAENAFVINPENEFINLPFPSNLSERNQQPIKLFTRFLWKGKTGSPLNIVLSGNMPGRDEYYFSFNVSEFIHGSEGWQPVQLQFVIPAGARLQDFKFYFYNSGKASARFKNLDVIVYF